MEPVTQRPVSHIHVGTAGGALTPPKLNETPPSFSFLDTLFLPCQAFPLTQHAHTHMHSLSSSSPGLWKRRDNSQPQASPHSAQPNGKARFPKAASSLFQMRLEVVPLDSLHQTSEHLLPESLPKMQTPHLFSSTKGFSFDHLSVFILDHCFLNDKMLYIKRKS